MTHLRTLPLLGFNLSFVKIWLLLACLPLLTLFNVSLAVQLRSPGNSAPLLTGVFTSSQCDTLSFGPKTDFGSGAGPRSVAVGDFNGDTRVDLAVANRGSNTVSILLGTGTGGFGPRTEIGTGSAPFSVAVGDLNGDGKQDIVTANQSGNSASVLLRNAANTGFDPKVDFEVGSGSWSVEVGDFNGDDKLDLVTANGNSNTVSILLGTGSGNFGPKTDFGTGFVPRSVGVRDFNGDNNLDLAVANQGSDTLSILLGTGSGSFGPKTDFATGSWPTSVGVGDFNGDGKLDIATSNYFGGSVSILRGTGAGSFGPKTDFATGMWPEGVGVADFNGDNKLDLAVTNGEFGSTVSILPGTGAGSFGPRTAFATGFVPRSVEVADFNGDSKPDLATANEASNTISILLDNCSSASTGSISVTTNLAAATFNIAGPSNYSGAGTLFSVHDAPAGMYTITYHAVPGYLTPPSETRTLTVGGAITFIGSYTLSCQVSSLTSITDPTARQFEEASPNTPAFSLVPPSVEATLDLRMRELQSDVLHQLGLVLPRSSGFRPLAYQTHFYELRTKLKEIQDAIRRDPAQATACQDLKNQIDYEVDTKHGITRDSAGLPQVNPPEVSAHTVQPALALDLGGVRNLTQQQQTKIDNLASLHSLKRPCVGDKPHFTLEDTPCSETIKATAESPVSILITDPMGRRIGFDPVTSSVVNEIGPAAFYSGPNTEPQLIEIGSTIPGSYLLTAVGTGIGPYTLTLERGDEDAEVIERQVTSGIITLGQMVSMSAGLPVKVSIDIEPGSSPNSINPSSKGVIPVAILSNTNFDVPSQVDSNSLTFGRTGDEKSLRRACSLEDVNRDGLVDLICHFSTQMTGFAAGNTQGVLKGRLTNNTPIEGVDWIRLVP